jgi:hypothetical protein
MLSSKSLFPLSVPALVGAMLLAGPGQAETRIESVAIATESSNEVVLQVAYIYDGDQGSNVAVAAVMATDGSNSSYYAYRPGRVERGRHRTRVTLGITGNAPEVFSTDEIEVAMYVGGGSAFVKRRFRFAKTWSQPGASLPPVIRLAEMRTGPLLQRAGRAVLEQGRPSLEIDPPDESTPGGAVERRMPDGCPDHGGL